VIVVDSSVWIDYFNGVSHEKTDQLDLLLGVDEIAVGDVILTEVLQGIRSDTQYRAVKKLLGSLTVIEMVGLRAAIKSAENFRLLRKRGITVRKTIDVLIATSCIHHRAPLLFSDKDFEPFVQHLGLMAA
jgi:predicted nucleic acid-binding protein